MTASWRLVEHLPLSARTTLEVGGPARAWADAPDTPSLLDALEWAAARSMPVEILGEGSNVLVADRGVEALVIRPAATGLLVRDRRDHVTVHASAGLALDRLVAWSVEHGLAGIECLSGIPGTVGAAPIQNAGAYGQEIADVVRAVHVVERQGGRQRSLAPDECAFGYRSSAFKGREDGRYVVAAVELGLRRGTPAAARNAELARRIESAGSTPTLVATRTAVLELRRSKSMVLDPEDDNRRSVGSFFVNPTLAPADIAELRARVAHRLGPDQAVPEYPASPPPSAATDTRVASRDETPKPADRTAPGPPAGYAKVPAAWLIEHAGMRPGYGRGRVGLSTRHTLAIVNRGGATAAEIVAFAVEVRERVFTTFGVWLAPEARLLGFDHEQIARLVDTPPA